LDQRDQRFLGRAARFQKARQVAALAQLRDIQRDGASDKAALDGHRKLMIKGSYTNPRERVLLTVSAHYRLRNSLLLFEPPFC
jgi:hypothetical protein